MFDTVRISFCCSTKTLQARTKWNIFTNLSRRRYLFKTLDSNASKELKNSSVQELEA